MPLDRRDGKVTAFVKSEKFDPNAKRNPDPRMIQLRNPRYNVEVGVYMRPMEKLLYTCKGPMGDRCIAKGLAPRQRASLLVRKMGRFDHPVVLSIDCSRWDKHLSLDVLKVEHSVYLGLCNDPYFRWLLTLQQRNEVVTSTGVRYTALGNRMSGDMNTALGNCLVMSLMVRAYAQEIGLQRWDYLDDGDDCLILVESRDESLVRETLQPVFKEFGQEVKLENRAMFPEEVVFCQSRPIFDGKQWTFVRDWRKALSHDCCGTRKWHVPQLVRGMLRAVGLCNLALNEGIPILQSWALACIRNGASAKIPKAFADDEEAFGRIKHTIGWDWDRILQPRYSPVTDEARLSFERAWGVTPQEQMDVEEILESWTVADVTPREYPVELDSKWDLNVHPEDPLAPYI
jgi:hypothetical protein